MSQVVTASRLHDGLVVFLKTGPVWVERLDEASLFNDKTEVQAALDLGKQAEADNLVVDVYAIDVSAKSGAVTPTKLREAIRARGPTVHPDFAKPGSGLPLAEEDDHVSV